MIQCTCADGSLWKPALWQAPLQYLTFISSLSLPCHALVDTPLPSVAAMVEGKGGSVLHVYGSDSKLPHRSGGASTSPSSTRLRRPSTSCPLSRHHLVAPCSASPLSAWRSKALLPSCWARWAHGSSASLVSCCRSSLARRGCVVRAAPRPWIRMSFCSSPCHHPSSSSKRGHIGTRWSRHYS